MNLIIISARQWPQHSTRVKKTLIIPGRSFFISLIIIKFCTYLLIPNKIVLAMQLFGLSRNLALELIFIEKLLNCIYGLLRTGNVSRCRTKQLHLYSKLLSSDGKLPGSGVSKPSSSQQLLHNLAFTQEINKDSVPNRS